MSATTIAVSPANLRLATYNLNSGVRSERPLHERLPAILNLLRKVDADVLCLQELRDIPGQPTALETLTEISIALGMTFVWVYRDGTPLAFVQAILWRPSRAMMIQMNNRWISEVSAPVIPSDPSTSKWGSVALSCQFLQRVGDTFGPRFLVTCVHFPLEEERKIQCMNTLRAVSLHASTTLYCPVFVMGDFNVFMDRRGKEQLEVMCGDAENVFVRHLTERYDSPDGSSITGTFFGEESDPFKQSMDSPSPLDHVFCFDTCALRTLSQKHTPVVHVVQEPDGTALRSAQPSDHCPVSVDVRV